MSKNFTLRLEKNQPNKRKRIPRGCHIAKDEMLLQLGVLEKHQGNSHSIYAENLVQAI